MRRIRHSRPWLAVLAISVLLGGAWLLPAWGGATCEPKSPKPEAVANAARLGYRVFETLEQSKAQVVLLGRIGADLSSYGLRFSHIGFVIRDAPQGSWTVLHVLNRCGTATSALYDEGLINFFLDDPFVYEAVIATPDPDTQQALAATLRGALVRALHQPQYNTIAHPQSQVFQNSNQWVLELLVAARADGRVHNRLEAQQHPLMQRYEPDQIHIDRLTRIGGGLFKANLTFTDHPLASRVKGDYAVVSVRSVLRFLQRTGMLQQLQRVDLQRRSNPVSEIGREQIRKPGRKLCGIGIDSFAA